jgi:hypothetical protein
MELQAALRERANVSLANPAVVKDADIEAASREANDLCGSRLPNQTLWLDIAYYRLQLRLKCDITELDDSLYKRAIAALKDAPIDSGASSAYNGVAKVAQRESQWAL